MADMKKLDRWADKLLDTGKRNNLISFKDSRASTAEVVFPDCQSVFSKCSVGHVFEVYDPKIPNIEIYEGESDEAEADNGHPEEEKKLSREEFKACYSPKIKSERYILTYTQTPNPLTAVLNIAKKAKEMLDETGINVAYLAFGFLKWREKNNSDIFYKAPLLLVHVNILVGSISDAVKIEVSDDDVVVNPTFDYLLKAEYGLSLPEYEDGETLADYYLKLSSAVQRLGWEVVDECKLGVFSFLKINMYEDLKKNSDLILKNDNVRILIGEPVREASSGLPENENRHIVENPLTDLHTVVDADSSQIEAIEMAKSGRSFVLQGPPGTGKSQTITNIIAECLHDGKKVLFVSEKQAALNVVFDKLKKAGLADFCLELHSHKANKKAVIEELNRTLEMPGSSVSSGAEEEIRQKRAAQDKLDGYAAALHATREPVGKSLYQLYELLSEQRFYPEIQFRVPDIAQKGQDYLLTAVRLLEQYEGYVPSIGQDFRQNPWYGFNDVQLDFGSREQLKSDLDLLSKGYRNLQSITENVKNRYETGELNFTDTARWQSLLAFFAETDVVTPALLSISVYNQAIPHFIKMKELSEVIVPLRDGILENYEISAVKELNGKDIYTRLTGEFNSFFTRMFSGAYKNLIAGITIHSKNGKKIKYSQAVDLSDRLMKLQSALDTYREDEAAVQGYLGRCYQGPDTDWNHVASSMELLRGYLSEEKPYFGTIPNMNEETFTESQGMFRTDAEQLAIGINAVVPVKDRVAQRFDADAFNPNLDSYSFCIQKSENCILDFDKLGNWISFIEVLKGLKKEELYPFIETVIENRIETDKITGAFRRGFYKQWIENIIFSVPEIASFTRVKQDQAVKNFVEKDRTQYEISKIQIKSELSQQRPNLDMVAGGSAVAILRREANKKRKQMPIRKLLSETGNLVQIIKPCFLMSPLSVSTFLDPEKICFDTIVFDEASQIFPQDAIGAVYRGRQLIVVGDSKQMPPSNFFNSSSDIDEDDEEVGDVTDFESILDVCSSVFTTERLAWHYRSHYEQLIAFSNLHFYNNNLVTFPSSTMDSQGIGVDYYYVEGTFDRKSKTNRAEAEFIVDLIYRNIEEYPDRSLGVVAFSAAQQSLIDKLLSKRREADASFEWFFKSDRSEPFFVKNLETVQGDERDTIIFSVAYAKDSQGKFIQNFGPLNREGGERRLNVAVTRAKDNVQLVASIHYTDINIANTASEGVRLLRAYLDYAQNGEVALERTITVTEESRYDSHFEQEVCDFLREEGFTVDTQVGCSGYRIDMGLRMPDSSDYLMAIECDGATYHRSKNARDRDSIRQHVLENMGWMFYRIWSTDWYKNNAVEKERLLKAVNDATKKKGDKRKVSENRKSSKKELSAEEIQNKYSTEVHENKFEFPEYRQLDAMQVLENHRDSFQSAVREILLTEAPVSEEFLLKRIVDHFNREKVTKAVSEDYNNAMQNCESAGIVRRNGFLYLKNMREIKFRVPGDRREIKYISDEELADGLYILIRHNISISKDNLYKALINYLGFTRMGDAASVKLDVALRLLTENGIIKDEDGLLSLK